MNTEITKAHLIKELQQLLEESLKETGDLKKKLDEAHGAQLMLGMQKEKLAARVDKLCVASEHLTHMKDVAQANGFRCITDAITAGRKWIEHDALVKREFDCFGEWLDGFIGDRRGEAYPVVREAFYAGRKSRLVNPVNDTETQSLLAYLNEQFPATVGHIPLVEKLMATQILLNDAAAQQQMLERAWGLIANAGGGNWKTQSRQWETTAEKWRDDWIKSAPDSAPPHIGEAWRTIR
ncbi:MAG: hypothetical protein ACOYM3_20590 [Terrimicrobiaceae bacterium]